jgi:hypothetical protein
MMRRRIVVSQTRALTVLTATGIGVARAQQSPMDEAEGPRAPPPTPAPPTPAPPAAPPPTPPATPPCSPDCAPARVVEEMSAAISGRSGSELRWSGWGNDVDNDGLQLYHAQYRGCESMIYLAHDPTSRAALVDAGGVDAARAAMALPDADEYYDEENSDCRCCSRTLRQECQWAVNAVDPPMYAAAAYLCLLAAAAGCAVAKHRRSRGLPACTPGGWLAALALDLGTSAVLLTWLAALDDGASALVTTALVAMGGPAAVLAALVVLVLSTVMILLPLSRERYALAGCGVLFSGLMMILVIYACALWLGSPVGVAMVCVVWVSALLAAGIIMEWAKGFFDRGSICRSLGFPCAMLHATGICLIFWYILLHVGYGDISTYTTVDCGCVLVLAAGAVFVRDGRAAGQAVVAAAGDEQLLGEGLVSEVVVSNPSAGAQSETLDVQLTKEDEAVPPV